MYEIRKEAMKNKYRGVTFVELMMAITIFGIMAAVGIGSMQSSKVDARLKAAQRDVASAIKLSQSYALQGKMENGLAPCGYGFRFTSSSQYEIFYKLPNGTSDCTDTNYGSFFTIETYSLNNSVTLSLPADKTSTELYTSIPFGKIYTKGGVPVAESVNDVGSSANPIATFTFSYNNKTKNLLIKPGGYIIGE